MSIKIIFNFFILVCVAQKSFQRATNDTIKHSQIIHKIHFVKTDPLPKWAYITGLFGILASLLLLIILLFILIFHNRTNKSMMVSNARASSQISQKKDVELKSISDVLANKCECGRQKMLLRQLMDDNPGLFYAFNEICQTNNEQLAQHKMGHRSPAVIPQQTQPDNGHGYTLPKPRPKPANPMSTPAHSRIVTPANSNFNINAVQPRMPRPLSASAHRR